MDWSFIKDFLAVAEAGSLSGASRRLKVSQPTLSRRISELEESLGATLFLRTPKGLLLTETGEGILADARVMEETALAIERRADAGREALDGAVRVSCTEGLGTHWLPHKLAAFHKSYPRLLIEILVDNRALNLVRREADIALRMFRPEQPDLVAKKIGRVTLGMYATASYLAEHGTPRRIADLKSHFHVGFDEAMTVRDDIQNLERLFMRDRIIHRSNSFIGQLRAAANGIGLAMVDCFLADPSPDLVRVLPDKLNYDMDVWLVTHAEIGRSARIRAVFDFIADSFCDDSALFAGSPVTLAG